MNVLTQFVSPDRSLLVVLAFMAIWLAVAAQPVQAQDGSGQLVQVGEIALTKGVVTARSDLRAITAVAKGSPVYLGDIIETASRSFTVIRFNDGGKVTLRPDSRFDINEYDDTAGQEKGSFELIKGGLRAVTGAIGKARPEEVKYTARNTTIGIRGTEFVIKLCEEGVDGCNYVSEGSDQTVGDVDKFVDIFIVDQDGGQRQRITRRELNDLLDGIYVSVIKGAIRVSTKDWFIDLQAGDKCVVDYSDQGLTSRSNNEEVECFVNSKGIEDIDVFLSDQAEKITVFNLFDDTEIYVGNEICEIN
jgi:hypothetical protein